MNKITKLLCIFTALSALFTCVPVFAHSSDADIISAYYNCIQNKNWATEKCVSPEYACLLTDASGASCRGEKRGAANVYSVSEVEIISRLEGSDYAMYAEGLVNPRFYLVSVKESVYKNDGFNFPGENFHIIICADVNGLPCVCDARLPLPSTVIDNVDSERAYDYLLRRFGETAVRAYSHSDIPKDFDFMPETIRVKRFHRDESKDAEIEEVDFKKYTYVVVCGEICPGYKADKYPEDYTQLLEWVKACAVAIRNFGWYKYLSSGVNADFHLYDCSGASSHHHPSISPNPADQLYLPEVHGSLTNDSTGSDTCGTRTTPHVLHKITIEGTDEIWDTIFLNDEHKLFLSICANGKYNGEYEHSGKLRHTGARYLAVEKGMDYKEILHYYYDNATGSTVVGNGGKVHIFPKWDVSMNETFNTSDAVWVLKYVAGVNTWENESENQQKIRGMFADANADGSITTSDAVKLLRILAGIDETPASVSSIKN